MIAASNHEFCFWHFCSEKIEGIDHELEALIGSPFSEGENSMFRRTTH